MSLRHEDEEILVFDDLLALTTCHLNGVPTSAYLPDWRYLLKAPERGLALIDSVFNRCWSVRDALHHPNVMTTCFCLVFIFGLGC